MTAIIVRNPKALLVPRVQTLLEQAISSVPYLAPDGLNSIAPDLMAHITDERLFMAVGIENGEHKSLVLGNLPLNNFFPYPVISVAYHMGSKALGNEMKELVVDFFLQAGYTKFWALNASGHSDKAWLKVFEKENVSATPIGTAFLFEVD